MGCPRRREAIARGCKLLPSQAEIHTQKLANTHQVATMNNFVTVMPKFDIKTFNRILTLWQIRHALPWSRIEDPWLQAAFYYLRPDAQLYNRKWSAQQAKELHVSLRDTVYDELVVSFLLSLLLVVSIFQVFNDIVLYLVDSRQIHIDTRCLDSER